MSPMRRDAKGRRELAPTWESLIDRQIREAMDEGEFDDLPYRGQRLLLEDDSAAGESALAFRMLRNAGFAPPWIEADKEVRALLARLEAVVERAPRSSAIGLRGDRAEIERLVADTNRAIESVNAEAPTDRQHRRRLDLATVLARLEPPHAGDAPGEAS